MQTLLNVLGHAVVGCLALVQRSVVGVEIAVKSKTDRKMGKNGHEVLFNLFTISFKKKMKLRKVQLKNDFLFLF